MLDVKSRKLGKMVIVSRPAGETGGESLCSGTVLNNYGYCETSHRCSKRHYEPLFVYSIAPSSMKSFASINWTTLSQLLYFSEANPKANLELLN